MTLAQRCAMPGSLARRFGRRGRAAVASYSLSGTSNCASPSPVTSTN